MRTLTGQLHTVSVSDDDEKSLVRASLAALASALDAQLFLKEPADDLLDDWPPGTIVGATTSIVAACACRIPGIRRRPPPRDHFEFAVPAGMLLAAYSLMLEERGIPFPGPAPLRDLPAAVRRLFQGNPRGWTSIVPQHWGEAATARTGTLN